MCKYSLNYSTADYWMGRSLYSWCVYLCASKNKHRCVQVLCRWLPHVQVCSSEVTWLHAVRRLNLWDKQLPCLFPVLSLAMHKQGIWLTGGWKDQTAKPINQITVWGLHMQIALCIFMSKRRDLSKWQRRPGSRSSTLCYHWVEAVLCACAPELYDVSIYVKSSSLN